MASGSSSTLKREHAVIAQPADDARPLCSKAPRRSYVDNNGVIVHEESPEEVSPPAAPKGATSGGSSPTLAPLAPEAPPMATSTPAQLPGTSTSPSAPPILVAENSLGIVAAEVVQEPVVVQPCQSYLPPALPCNSSCPSVADPPVVVVWPSVAQPLVPSSLREIFIKHVMCDFTSGPRRSFRRLGGPHSSSLSSSSSRTPPRRSRGSALRTSGSSLPSGTRGTPPLPA